MGASEALRQLAQAAMDGAVAIDTLTAENTTLRQTLDSRDLALAAQSVALDAARTRPAAVAVKPGETMTSIADVHGVTKDQVKAWNPGIVPTAMPVGSTLWLIDRATMPQAGEPPPVAYTSFSWDISDLGNDKTKPDAQKIASHKTLFAVDSIHNVREFFGTAVPTWNTDRLNALTDKDSVVISTLSRDRAAIAAFLKATPDRFLHRKGQVKLAHGHEREANLTTPAALQDWLDGNEEKADLLVAAPHDTMSEDELVKIGLHFSQHHETNPATPNREQLYGGQNFGVFGEDCYSYRTWINQRNRYETPEELFGDYVAFLRQIGLPGAIPEWGAERASTNGAAPMDSTGEGRAKFITDGGNYLRSLRMDDGSPLIQWVNWWCADGFRDGQRVLHHLEEHGTDSPEVAAYRELVAA